MSSSISLRGLYSEGLFFRGFFVFQVWGVYIWRGLFSEFYGIKYTTLVMVPLTLWTQTSCNRHRDLGYVFHKTKYWNQQNKGGPSSVLLLLLSDYSEMTELWGIKESEENNVKGSFISWLHFLGGWQYGTDYLSFLFSCRMLASLC